MGFVKNPPDKLNLLNNKKFIDYVKKLSFNEFNKSSGNFIYGFLLKQFNEQFKNLVQKMIKDVCLPDNQIIPSIMVNYTNDSKIRPFWNPKIEKLSKKLFLPEINKRLTDKNILTHEFDNSWFNISCKTNNQLKNKIKFEMPKNNMKTIQRSVQIKLFLNVEQKRMMKIIIGTYRYFYNRTIQFVNNYNKKKNTTNFLVDPKDVTSIIKIKIIDKCSIYSLYTARKYLKQKYPMWIDENFPSHLIDQAISEALINTLTNIKKYKKTGKKFQMAFKSKNNIYQTINLEKSMVSGKTNSIFGGFKSNRKLIFKNLKTSEKINKYDYCGSSLTYHSVLSEYTLNLGINKETIKNHEKDQICAGDLGVRTFLTLYDSEKVTCIGNKCMEKIYKKCKEVDIIQSRISRKSYYDGDIIYEMNAERKRNLRKAMHRRIKEIRNLRNELHNKTINYLVKNYSKIIISPFEIQEMVKDLNSKVARNMYTLSFYTFKKKLEAKCEEKNVSLIIKSECFTSKTCTGCGKIQNLGKDRVYKCKGCKIKIERDVNGARNILLKNIHFC